jgi:hypothetical protein
MGDVYYENGIAVGMVWWLADTIAVANGVAYGEHGKLISLIEPVSAFPEGLLWGLSHPDIKVPAYDTLDGRINTPVIVRIRDSAANDPVLADWAWRFQAVSWCVDSLGGDWYLPALHELRTIITLVVPVLNPALKKIQNAKTFIDLWNAGYWTSTADETNNRNAYIMNWGKYPHYSNIPDYSSMSLPHSTPSLVRAVRWF